MLSTHAGAPTDSVVRELPRVRAAQLASRVEGLRPGLVGALLGRSSVVGSDLLALRAVEKRVANGHPLDLQAMDAVLTARRQYDLDLDQAQQDGVADQFETPKSPDLQILEAGERQLIVNAAQRQITSVLAQPGAQEATPTQALGGHSR